MRVILKVTAGREVLTAEFVHPPAPSAGDRDVPLIIGLLSRPTGRYRHKVVFSLGQGGPNRIAGRLARPRGSARTDEDGI